jgi:hypothetical protein
MLIGIDVLRALDAEIHFASNEIVIGKQVIVAGAVRDSTTGKRSEKRQVYLVGRAKLPAHSTTYAIGRVTAPIAKTFLLEPVRENLLCLVPASLHSRGELATIQIVNDTDSAIFLEPDIVIGTARQAQPLDLQPRGTRKVRRVNLQARKNKPIPPHLVDLYTRSCDGLSAEQQESLKCLLIEYADVFAAHDLDLGTFTALPHRIPVDPTTTPTKERMRRVPKGFEKEEEKHLQEMLAAGVIQPSVSPWAAAPVLVRKKDGGVRWCIDFRKLNTVTKKDAFPLPLISDCLDALSENIFMSTLDMASGYWQITIHPADREKTAFITRFGLFEHVRMSFGLCNAPSTFQRVMNLVLRGLTWNTVLAFLDDILVLGKNFDDHLKNLEEVLQRFRTHNLKLKPKKCSLFRRKAKFLGKIVSGDSLEVDPESIAGVKDWPRPTRTKDVDSFLGFVNYHREHLPHLADMAAPLYELTG